MPCNAIQMLDILIATAFALAAPLPDDAPQMPLAKWRVDWGDTNCLALQDYGDAKKPTTFALKPSLDDDVIRVMISRKGPYQNASHFDVKFGDVKTTALGFTPPKSGMEIFWINIPRADFDRLVSAPALEIKGRRLDLTLSTQGFAAAVAVMDQCNTDLRAHWNADEAGQARIAAKPVALVSPWKLVRSGDYPDQAISEGRDGSTGVSLLIDEHGAIKDCVVEHASGVATLDAQTCIMIKQRGKFSAAKDAQGKPVKSRVTYRFRWISR